MACQSTGLQRSGDPTSPGSTPPSATAAVGGPSSAGAAAPGASQAVDPAKLAEVEAQVKQSNDAAKAERDHFVAEGWTIVDGIPAPDARVLGYDAALINADPDALRTQLASTTPTSEDLPQVVKIAQIAQSPELRLNAIEALGRMHSDAAQAALVDLLASGVFGSDEAARMTAAPLVRPRDLDDSSVMASAMLLDSPLLGDVEKNQIAFTLAAIGLRDGTTLPDAVLNALSATAKQRISTMRAVAQN
ncbi:MAG: hypothetical protein IT381_09685 [Deltaproteobacteria bacterium]|nr:hypothetical protein [Deltaproteobacteria bacterium]